MVYKGSIGPESGIYRDPKLSRKYLLAAAGNVTDPKP